MVRTNVDVDEKACAEVMRRFGLTTKRAAVNFALRTLAAEPLSVDEARRMRGTGWEGDPAEMRAARVSWSEHGHSVTQLPHHEPAAVLTSWPVKLPASSEAMNTAMAAASSGMPGSCT